MERNVEKVLIGEGKVFGKEFYVQSMSWSCTCYMTTVTEGAVRLWWDRRGTKRLVRKKDFLAEKPFRTFPGMR